MTAEDQGSFRTHMFTEPFIRCGRALAEWLAHTVLACGIIGCITLIDRVMHTLMGTEEALFFSVLPVSWVFQAADFGVLVGISYHGVKAAVAAYRGLP